VTIEKPTIVAVVGPTASGKSALAVALAKRLSGEIISCDSMQIYRKMNIGTAKPTEAELAAAPHHMIDIADIGDNFSCALYADMAKERKIPLLPIINYHSVPADKDFISEVEKLTGAVPLQVCAADLKCRSSFLNGLTAGLSGILPESRCCPPFLNDLLPPGRHELGIMATCHGEPFYSFFTVTLSDGNGDSYTLKFRNDIEPDRAFIHFDVEL
jgi:hypothetical protein